MKELVRVNSAAIHQNKTIEIYSSSEKLANEFGRVDLASKGIIYIIDKQPKDANKIRNILKKFPDELNYSYYILYSIKADREDVNFRYRAKDFNEKVNFKKLDPDFQNKLDEYLPNTPIVAKQKKFKEPAKAKVQHSIYNKSAHRSGGDRENKLLYFYNSYIKKTPPSDLDQCNSADNWIKKNKLIDDTGEAEFYLYLIWDAYHKKYGRFSLYPTISKNKVSDYLNDAHSKNYLDAIWHHYCTGELPEEVLLNNIFQNIEHKEIDGSPKSIFNDILKAHYKITRNKLSSGEDKVDLLNFLQPYFDRKKDIEEAFVNSSFMNSEVREDIKKFQDFYKHNK